MTAVNPRAFFHLRYNIVQSINNFFLFFFLKWRHKHVKECSENTCKHFVILSFIFSTSRITNYGGLFPENMVERQKQKKTTQSNYR